MKITILGSGSAYGTPMIFNDWGRAISSNPLNMRLRASIFLEDENKRLLVDAGPDLREQINRENITDFDAVFLTHPHYDHIGGVPELPRASKILGHKIDVFASNETFEELKKCYAYLFTGGGEPDSGGLVWHVLKDENNYQILRTWNVRRSNMFRIRPRCRNLLILVLPTFYFCHEMFPKD